jgi:itaconate CoA-transferase
VTAPAGPPAGPSAGPRGAAPAGPLAGLLVVALEQAVAVPFATRQLADLGARVVKIERPDGGDFARSYDTSVRGQSSYFVWLNRGKESVTLDVKSGADRSVLFGLIDAADVFVQNLGPGAAGRLGLDAGTLHTRHPRLVIGSVSGYGDAGPYRPKKAYDLLVQCEVGLVAVTGTPQEPAKSGISVADIAAGMYAYSGILAALYERERTGRGSVVDIAMIDALGEWMTQPVLRSVYGTPPPRTGARHALISPYGPYRTADGTIFLGVQNDREWVRLCADVLGTPGLAADVRFATNPDRLAHDAALTDLVDARLARLSTVEAIALLDAAGIANAQLRTPAEFAAHPQLAARDRWREVGTPGGPVRALLPPGRAGGVLGAVPALGEHTDAVRAEFGGVP